jgi:hypothetical protein
MTEQLSFPPLHDLALGELETRKRHLLGEIERQPEQRPVRPRLALIAVAAVCVAAACAVVFSGALGGSDAHRRGTNAGGWSAFRSGNELGYPPTLSHPLPLDERQVTLADAVASLGAPIVLPNTTLVDPSDLGAVWEDGRGAPTQTTVAVTFPSQGVIVGYTRPAPSNGSAAHFQAMLHSMLSPSGVPEAEVITLNGTVPALAVHQNSDETGANFGAIIFNVGDSEVRVIGHKDQATLTDLASSILSQDGTTG